MCDEKEINENYASENKAIEIEQNLSIEDEEKVCE